MGGNALKNTETERATSELYNYISKYTINKLNCLFPESRASCIIAYQQKESFGNCDILLASDNLPPNWKKQIEEEFKPNEIVNNGNVMSFDVMKLQIDIITVPDKELHMASTYFAFNDMGNLMGRIAQKMGFKYGSNGLCKPLFDASNQKFAEIHVSQDPAAIFSFLGYDWTKFTQGFNTLEDIFEFAVSTPFFHREIYLLENRNNYSRTRDAKRPTYTAFLQWLKDKPNLDKYAWESFGPKDVDTGLRYFKENHTMNARADKMFPGLAIQITEAIARNAQAIIVKRLFNGFIVNELTGYSGKELGQFIAFCREQYADFDDFILNNPSDIKEMIVLQKARFEMREQ